MSHLKFGGDKVKCILYVYDIVLDEKILRSVFKNKNTCSIKFSIEGELTDAQL